MPFSGQSLRACSAQLKLLHGKKVEFRVGGDTIYNSLNATISF